MIPLPLRLVLDTNAWLDWLVFDDAAIAPIRAAVASGKARIFIDAACEQELARVLAYELGKIALDADAQAACLAECRRVAQMAKTDEREIGQPNHRITQSPKDPLIKSSSRRRGSSKILNPLDSRLRGNDKTILDQGFPDHLLPVCRDPDDQKFLELARDCRADYLVTKDRELLVLARRRLRPVPFRIVTPLQIGDTLRAE